MKDYWDELGISDSSTKEEKLVVLLVFFISLLITIILIAWVTMVLGIKF